MRKIYQGLPPEEHRRRFDPHYRRMRPGGSSSRGVWLLATLLFLVVFATVFAFPLVG